MADEESQQRPLVLGAEKEATPTLDAQNATRDVTRIFDENLHERKLDTDFDQS